MSRTLVGRVVAVTGGARGIGRAVAAHLAAGGAHVAIGDRDTEQARAGAAQLPGKVEAFDCDVTDTSSFSAFLEAVRERLGPIDVLVNNAGLMWVGPFEQEPEEAARRQIEVNLHGTIRGVKLAAPAMRARGSGHIVTIASAAARLSPAGESTYAATKHGVLGYMSGVRSELRGSGVELSVVMPGVVETELAAGTATGAARLLTPEEVARAVAALVRRPRFEVSLPAYVGPLARWAQVLPQRLRDVLLRLAVPDQLAALPDKRVRHSYEDRNLSGPRNTGEEL
ncbi:SDR family oxidoreductase [Nocardiopsis kunsanensis]|uniref:Short-chain dehydrogenase n=1 Tax=Nocardiopsis kunsanensis TaxID=141693 RepID=A0A919CGE0_9ACTN|nr:SDR family oxidoreductase [Nocardiopsis kunsanensis]GHD19618.1 short-chain dehydrogenase [Nocardiopsis kunsanensis]